MSKRSWERLFSSISFPLLLLSLARANSLDSWRVKQPCHMQTLSHACVRIQHKRQTERVPPVPDTALHVCHGLLAQIHDRSSADSSLKNVGACVCERERP